MFSVLQRFAQIISTFCFIGYLPLVPGTFGSLAALLLFINFFSSNYLSQLWMTLFVSLLGFLFSGIEEKHSLKKDPKHVVIDEVAGMFITLMFLPFYDIRVFISAFILFRVLDTLKPYPAYKMQDLHGSFGIMIDDIIAGVYANIILQIVLRFVSPITS